jgi:hypothetical protein
MFVSTGKSFCTVSIIKSISLPTLSRQKNKLFDFPELYLLTILESDSKIVKNNFKYSFIIAKMMELFFATANPNYVNAPNCGAVM